LSQRRVEAASERIDRVFSGSRSDIGLQPVMSHDIDASIEQSGDIVFDGDVFIDLDPGRRIDLDHDIDVAVGAFLSARARTEQRRMPDAPLAQRPLVLPQPGDDIRTVYMALYNTLRRTRRLLVERCGRRLGAPPLAAVRQDR